MVNEIIMGSLLQIVHLVVIITRILQEIILKMGHRQKMVLRGYSVKQILSGGSHDGAASMKVSTDILCDVRNSKKLVFKGLHVLVLKHIKYLVESKGCRLEGYIFFCKLLKIG